MNTEQKLILHVIGTLMYLFFVLPKAITYKSDIVPFIGIGFLISLIYMTAKTFKEYRKEKDNERT